MQLTRLIRLLEITRSMPQTGYALSEIRKEELSDLAQHHYLVTAIAWQLARAAIRAGGKLDLARVLEFSLIHDLGEVFGGDIGMPYARANDEARTAAKRFEAINQQYLAQFFGEDEQYVTKLSEEILDAKSDEAVVAKIADYMEVTHYKLYLRRLTPNDGAMAREIIAKKLDQLGDPTTERILRDIAEQWAAELEQPTEELFDRYKAPAEITTSS
ncbi:HD domain-containing protein [Candidatus Berkelbacteria bacterium]|nr:HD domain-containing protein [Candidatus Berkelbacteria bacterium]